MTQSTYTEGHTITTVEEWEETENFQIVLGSFWIFFVIWLAASWLMRRTVGIVIFEMGFGVLCFYIYLFVKWLKDGFEKYEELDTESEA